MFDCITSKFHVQEPRTFEFSANEPATAAPIEDAKAIFKMKLDDIEKRATAIGQVLNDEIGKLLALMADAVEEYKNAQYGRRATEHSDSHVG